MGKTFRTGSKTRRIKEFESKKIRGALSKMGGGVEGKNKKKQTFKTWGRGRVGTKNKR